MIDNSLLETIARSASTSVFLELPRDRPVIPPAVRRQRGSIPANRLLGLAVSLFGRILRQLGRRLTATGDRLLDSVQGTPLPPRGCVPS